MENYDWDAISQKAFEQFMTLYVIPEIQRREAEGRITQPFNLIAAQAVFFPDNRPLQIRLNEEVKAQAEMKLKPHIVKQPSEPVWSHELESLGKFTLSDDDDPDCGHITLIRLRENGWQGWFDFRYNKALARKHIETAGQFRQAAEFSLQRENWTAFVDNLFSAAELVAKAILLTGFGTSLRNKSNHKAIQIRFNQFANLGNVDSIHAKTFNNLSKLRYRARYIEDQLSISNEDALHYLTVIQELEETALQHLQT